MTTFAGLLALVWICGAVLAQDDGDGSWADTSDERRSGATMEDSEAWMAHSLTCSKDVSQNANDFAACEVIISGLSDILGLDYSANTAPPMTPSLPPESATPSLPLESVTPPRPLESVTPSLPPESATPSLPLESVTPSLPLESVTPPRLPEITTQSNPDIENQTRPAEPSPRFFLSRLSEAGRSDTDNKTQLCCALLRVTSFRDRCCQQLKSFCEATAARPNACRCSANAASSKPSNPISLTGGGEGHKCTFTKWLSGEADDSSGESGFGQLLARGWNWLKNAFSSG